MTYDYGFYIKRSPLGDARTFKIGISALRHIDSRRGTYQNSFGPTYKERFETLWVGPEQDIRELERLLKIKFRKKVAGTSRGLTEWITDIKYEDLVAEVITMIEGVGVTAVYPYGEPRTIFKEDIAELKSKFLTESK